MDNGQTVSLKEILWKVFNNPLAEGLSYEDAAEFAIEGIKLIGSALGYEHKITDPPIEINNYKGLLPENLINIRGVKYNGKPLNYATDIYHKERACEECPEIVYNTYSIKGGIIFTSFKEGCVTISYKALQVDKDGYPLIPNNQKYKFAIEYYILFRYLEPLWLMGKITDKAFTYIQQKKHWYIGGAQTSMQLQSMDHLEATMNSINRLLVDTNMHSNGYRGLGKKEFLKRHN